MNSNFSYQNRKLLIVIAVVAVIIRLIFVIVQDPIPELSEIDLDEADFDFLGNNIAAGVGYVDKYGNPTTSRFPLYPAFLGIVYFIFGHHIIAAYIMQALLGFTIPVIVYFISREFFDRKISLLAAGIAAVYPSYVVYSGRLMTENLFLPLLALVILFVLRLRRDFSIRNAALAGFTLGLACLTRGSAVPMMVLIPLWFLLFGKITFFNRLKRTAIMVGVMALTLSPWIIRNYIHLNRIMITSSSGGVVLWMSYQWIPIGHFFELDRAYAYVDSVGRENARQEVFNRILVEDNLFGIPGAAEGIKLYYPDEEFPENEAEFSRYMMDKAKTELFSNPRFLAAKTVKEFLRFWHFLDDRANFVFSYGVMLPFFLWGLWLLRRRLREFWLLLAFFLYAWGLETLFMADARFRMPFEMVMIVIGAYAMVEMFRRMKPVIVPIALVVFVLGMNLFLSYNVDSLRFCIRKAATILGLKVAETSKDYIPHLKDGDSREVY
ncbi:MAG: glycosyltransferase family 39 protein [candidate division Zixibacteria bacterium]|nr:glycosyltransferase family 39 protein [Candidatus Tariuqbacter arcticus]